MQIYSNQKSILITGSSGWIGSALAEKISESESIRVVCASRKASKINKNNTSHFFCNDEIQNQDWTTALKEVSTVVHLAARVHVMSDRKKNPIIEYRKVNVEGTLNLARQAVKQGVKRFIFVSSIKVNGESTKIGEYFKPDDIPNPTDPYGISKMEAEIGLYQIAKNSSMDVVIIRPALVYGQGVRANFASLMSVVIKQLPLPFGSVRNKRSFVSIDNLIDFVITCINHPKAANQTFLVSDGVDMSTSEVIRCISDAAGVRSRVIDLPIWFLQLFFKIIGKTELLQRLLGNLQVDISKSEDLLGWIPPMSMKSVLEDVLEKK